MSDTRELASLLKEFDRFEGLYRGFDISRLEDMARHDSEYLKNGLVIRDLLRKEMEILKAKIKEASNE